MLLLAVTSQVAALSGPVCTRPALRAPVISRAARRVVCAEAEAESKTNAADEGRDSGVRGARIIGFAGGAVAGSATWEALLEKDVVQSVPISKVAGPAFSDLSKAVESGGASIKLPEIPSDFSSLKAPDVSSFTAPDFSSIKAPDFSGLKMPDLSNLKLPDAPDLSSLQLPDAPDLSSLKLPDVPDMSNLKLPDAPDLSGLKLPDAPDLSSLTSSLPPNPLAVQPASALEYDPSSLAAPDLSAVKMPEIPEIDLSSLKLPELDSAALLSKLTEAAAPLVKALSSAGIDLSSIDEKALTSGATDLANSATGLASGAANDAITTAGSFSGEVWTPLGLGVIGAVALGAVAEREDVVGTALRLIGRVVDVLVVGGLTLTFSLLKTIISSLAGLVTGAIVGAFVGPGPVLGVLSQTATQGVKDKFASDSPAAASMAADVPKE
jgi:hypothetical protein